MDYQKRRKQLNYIFVLSIVVGPILMLITQFATVWPLFLKAFIIMWLFNKFMELDIKRNFPDL